MNELPKTTKFKLPFLATTKIASRLGRQQLINNFKYMQRTTLAGVTVAAVLTIMVATSAYAYNSPSVTYGSPLYPIKREMESTKIAMSSAGLPKVQAYLNQADRRMSEAEHLVNTNDYSSAQKVSLISTALAAENDGSENNFTKTLNDAGASTSWAAAETNTIKETSAVSAAVTALQNAQASQEKVLIQLAAKVDLKDEAATDGIAKALEATKKNLEDFNIAKGRVDGLKEKEATKVEEKIVNEEKNKEDSLAKKDITLEQVIASFDAYKAKKADLLASLGSFPAEKVSKLMEKLSNKEVKIQAAIDGSNLEQAMGLIKAAIALQNNAKHFLTEVKDVNKVKIDEDSSEGDKQKSGREDEQKAEEDKQDSERQKEELKNQVNSNLNTNTPHEENNGIEDGR